MALNGVTLWHWLSTAQEMLYHLTQQTSSIKFLMRFCMYQIMSLLPHIFHCIFILIVWVNSFNISVNINETEIEPPPLLDVSKHTLYFKSYHFIWNDYAQWTWNTSYINHINTESLCICTQFTTNTKTTAIESLKPMKIYYDSNNISSNNASLDFWNDLDWSQVNILHHNDISSNNRRQLLIPNKYDTDDAYDNAYEYEYNEDEVNIYLDDEGLDINSMKEPNDYLFNLHDNVVDVYGIDDYYKWYVITEQIQHNINTKTAPIVIINDHVYTEPGTYPVNVTVTDKYGKKGNANLTQQIKDPNEPDKIYPPVADVESHPHESVPKQPVIFDASNSQDFEGNPCKKFVWDFGDGTPKKTTSEPETHHPYKTAGTYPVTVEVTDKHGQSAKAGLNQRVRPTDPEDPYVAVSSTPPIAKKKEPVTFDASKSHDMDGDPCKNYTWDFGDGSPLVHTPKPVVKHAYDEPGTYPVAVTATDKYGRKGNAALNQKVVDPKNPNPKDPPYAHVTSDPTDAKPSQPVTFDASKSHDMNKKPCVKFVWDFGDGTPKKTTKTPTVKHAYKKPNVYPVSVQVTDKNGLTSDAFLNQRVSDPSVSDSDPSRGGKGPKNKNYGGKKGRNPVGNTFNSVGNNKGYSPEQMSYESREILFDMYRIKIELVFKINI